MADQETPPEGGPRPLTVEDIFNALPEQYRARARAAAESSERGVYGDTCETEEERAEREAAQRAALVEERVRRHDDWVERVPARFKEARLGALAAHQDPQGAVSGFLARGAWMLLLVGETGVGKTHLAFAIGNTAATMGQWVYGGTVPDLLDEMRAYQSAEPEQKRKRRDAFADLVAADLVILDDLGVERATEFAAEMVQRIVDARWGGARPTVITTNLTPAEIEDRYGSRVLDRIGEGAVLVKLESDSMRKRPTTSW
jgi:DNA replication protein DnaC